MILTAAGAPRPLKVAAALVLLESLALVVLSVAELFDLTAARATMGVSTSLFFVGTPWRSPCVPGA